ncbi:DEAD/DEAH box helicase, putative [Plasmodium chabaudi chabaudi]|uniref:DEAD/DEAH box helicase, putative n=1 Tax=Plasmodium chabaudi chabaudi TaxID=31271 RepID=A0A4V0K414_PLACU|nr:DEAD/DEAH box helicase, putative [Plasmodium chabaudi chabaudi]VTZ67066.1 DEAD/DEAH box helicase, putative [Plasmodium chabaudi chabaudi]|eukprot:XP_016653220.1 DEAD/DEAH helicase, putative [Plasmodium chabaudi chabaudi]
MIGNCDKENLEDESENYTIPLCHKNEKDKYDNITSIGKSIMCKSSHRIETSVNNEIEKEKELDISKYVYLSEHLQIRKDKQISMSSSLNKYINDNINFIRHFTESNKSLEVSKKDVSKQFVDIGVKIRFLLYRDKIKKYKKYKKKYEEKNAMKLKRLGNNVNELYEKVITSKQDTISNQGVSTHCGNESNCSDSSCLLSDSSIENGNKVPKNVEGQDHRIIKHFNYKESDLHTIKRLEKNKNKYFEYLDSMYIKYGMLNNMNISYFQNIQNIINKNVSDINITDKVDNEMKNIKQFFSNQKTIKNIEKNQNMLRTDILNAMFGFNIISDTQCMKLPIKYINRDYEYKHKEGSVKNDGLYDHDLISKSVDNERNPFLPKLRNVKEGKKGKEVTTKSRNNKVVKKAENIIDKNTKEKICEYIYGLQKKNCKMNGKIKSLKQYVLLNNWKDFKNHNIYINMIDRQKKENEKLFATLCYDQMNYIKEKKQIILEKEEKERLKLLRENNMDEYIKLIKNVKNKRIQELLDVTDKFLNTMSHSVLHQKGEAASTLSTASKENTNAREKYYDIAHTIKEKITKQPSILVGGNLMKYQLEGLEWLVSLHNNNLNGILADEMGLGKTVQTISLFAYLKELEGGEASSQFKMHNEVGKNLIIVPLSTLPNWSNEFEKWCPSLNVIIYKGNKNERKDISKVLLEENYDICLTTFDIIIREKNILGKISWSYIIIDEGHRMKNDKSKLHSILSLFISKHRILLTGTPLQNNMTELWALLNFILPKIFSSSSNFEEWFSLPLCNEKNVYESMTEEEELLIINRLHTILLPFMLRRLKKDVLEFLPKKYEYNIYVQLSLYQKLLYKQIEEKTFKQVNSDGTVNTKSFQNTIMQLRKIVNHPFLFTNNYDINDCIIKSSGKFEVLDRMIPKLIKFKHKILLFCQMTRVMDILCDYFELRRYKYHRLDGSVSLSDRRQIIDNFNEPKSVNNCKEIDQNDINDLSNQELDTDEAMIFILSTRSGGLGLNLQAADTVIIFDSDFNPHQDIQAMCRCHRIGQKNVVKVFRFITLSSVEELVFQRAKDKLNINDKVIQAGLFNKIYNDNDRQTKLKNIIKKNQKYDTTLQPTNPIMLNEYMSRTPEELEYFLNFDRNYFGEDLFVLLQSMRQRETQKSQFRYVSEDEEEGEEKEEETAANVDAGDAANADNADDADQIEQILIKSNKLVNEAELPVHLFCEDIVEKPEINFKRTRKVINYNLMYEEELTEDQFCELIDPDSPQPLSQNNVNDPIEIQDCIENEQTSDVVLLENQTDDAVLLDNNQKEEQNRKGEMTDIETIYLEEDQRKDEYELDNQDKQTDVEREENGIKKRKGDENSVNNFEKKYSEFSEMFDMLNVSTKLQEDEKENRENKKRKKISGHEM